MNWKLTTERLCFREMTAADREDLCEMLQDAEVMYAYAHAFSDGEVDAWLRRQQQRYRQNGFGLWALLLRQSGEMIGQAGLTMQNADGKEVLEIGYLLKKRHWHKGYAAEAAQALKRYAFETLKADAVYSIIRDSNAASIAVAQRNGMRPAGCLVKHYYGIDMPHIIYRITREEAGYETE